MTIKTRRFCTAVLTVGALLGASLSCSGGEEPQSKQQSVTAGAQLWTARYHAGGETPAVAQSLAVSRDGTRVFVTGSAGTVAYDAATGDQKWVAASTAFAGSGGSTQPPTLAVSSDGTKVFVAGTSERGPNSNYVTFAYNAATGAQLWTKTYDGPAGKGDGARAVAASPSADVVFVYGFSDGTGTGSDMATVAYAASTGEQHWVARYNGPANADEGLFLGGSQALAVSSDGAAVYVTGASKGTGQGHDYATVAYNAKTGTQQWASRYSAGPKSDSYPMAVAVSKDSVYVTGGSDSGTSAMDVTTIAYDPATGTQRWLERYNAPANVNEGGTAIALTSDTVLVSGTGEGATLGKEDYVSAAYRAATGAQLWLKRYDGPDGSDDNGYSNAVANDGKKLYVTGWSNSTSAGHDFATVAYDTASGNQLWVARYSSPGQGDDEARCVAVSPTDGTVFVTGGGNGDYATVAYRG